MSKVVKTLREAISLCGLQSGMTISFHHNLRGGDTIAGDLIGTMDLMGLKELKIAPSSLLTGHDVLVPYIKNKTISRIDPSGFTPVLGDALQRGLFEEVCTMRTHGARARDLENGTIKIDVAFIAVSCCDKWGNCNALAGRSAFGSLGYSIMDARYAKKVVVITDGFSEEPIAPISIDQSLVDYVVLVETIGDPSGIVTTSLKPTKDPVSLKIAAMTAELIRHSGMLKDGVCMQTGAGGISLAVTSYLERQMLADKIAGGFAMGGITGALAGLLEKGLLKVLYDVQTFDLGAIESLSKNKNHLEVSASMYASPDARGKAVVDGLDFVILGGTEIDVDFNVNVHTDSGGRLISGAGGHGDTAQGAKMTIVTAPAFRARTPTLVDRVNTISTPGRYVDVYVCQRGIAVNSELPQNKELFYRLKSAGLPVRDIHDLKKEIERMTGVPNRVKKGNKTVGRILWRDGSLLDEVKSLAD